MRFFVDTGVWAMAFRRDVPASVPEVACLSHALAHEDLVFTTGFVLQELLQGFHEPAASRQILEHFAALPLLVPSRDDHIEAAALRELGWRHNIRIGTMDALLAQLCLHHDLILLTSDPAFARLATLSPLSVWHE